MPTFDSEGNDHTRDRKNQQFYVGNKGSYQVTATVRPDGSMDTDLKATYRNGQGEKCFYARGESHCWRIDVGGTFETASRPAPRMPQVSARKKRETGPLVYTDFNITRVLKVVYVVDKSFMDWFRDLSGDDELAIEDAEDYIYMLNNEATYLYRGVKEISENSFTIPDMDIAVYAQGFYYPRLGTEWYWLVPWIEGDSIIVEAPLNANFGAFPRFGRWVGQGYVDWTGPFDTATFITRRRLEIGSSGLLGISYFDSICNPEARDTRVSFNLDGFFDVAITLVHEVGHSFSVVHDNNDECPPGFNLMSPYAFAIDSTTENTWNRWSTCSVRQMVEYVNDIPGCLLDGNISDDDFYDQLCMGVRGGNQFDVDYQCQSATSVQTSVACSPNDTVDSGKVPADACWDDGLISCTDSEGDCSSNIFTIFDGTPCAGLDSSKDYVCYRGDCLEKVDVCAGRPTEEPPVCSCAELSGISRYQCCRSEKNADDSCCIGCRINLLNTACVIDF